MERDKVVAAIRDLVSKMGLSIKDIQVSEVAGHTLFTLVSDDSGALIGHAGDTLHALNHLIKKTFEKEAKGVEPFRFVIDVNGYHLKHIKMLEANAYMLAERARTFKYDVEMSPMSPYDRMIVHASLSGAPNIRTESMGDGPLRHIVIRYSPEESVV
jgi:spoIIIJ-associated protein